MNVIRKQSITSIKWSAFERFANQGIRFLISVILARLLTPDAFGVIGLLAIFLSISQSFIDCGFSNALIRKKSVTDVDFSTVFYFNIVVGIICYAILFFVSSRIAAFFNVPILTQLLRVIAINVIVNSLIVVQVAKLTINVDFKTQAKASLSASLVSGIVGITLAYQGYGVWSLAAQSIVQTVLNALLLWWFTRWIPLFVFSWSSFHNLFSFGSKILLSGLIHQVYQEMTTILIGRYYTAEDLGYYTRGNQFASLPSVNLISVLQRVTFPIFSKIQDDNVQLINVYRKYIRITSLFIFFLMMLLAALAKPLILIVLTDKWTEAIQYLQLFCFALMFDHITIINLNLLQVKGRSDLYLKLEIIKKSISIVILLFAIPFGVVAVCASKIVYSQIALYINTYYTGKMFDLTYMRQMVDFIPYFMYSILACLPVFVFTFMDIHPLVLLLFGSMFSTLFYVSVLRFMKDDSYIKYVQPYFLKIRCSFLGR